MNVGGNLHRATDYVNAKFLLWDHFWMNTQGVSYSDIESRLLFTIT